MKLNILGMDIASKSCQASLLNSDKQEAFNEVFRNNKADMERLLKLLPEGCIVIMESTSHYHLQWARFLVSYGFKVYVINPLLASRMQSAAQCLRKNKTDKIDARQLALFGLRDLGDLQTYVFRKGSNINAVRQLAKTYRVHRKILTELQVSAKMLLEMMMPQFESLDIGHSVGLVDLFLEINSWDELKRMHRSTLQRYASSATEELVEIVRGEVDSSAEFDAYLPALQCRLKVIKQMREALIEMRAAIRKQVTACPRMKRELKLVSSIPGFGPRTAAPIISSMPPDWEEWGVSKRKLARKLQAYWGFDPRKRESGEWKGVEHISKRGSELARTALFQAAMAGRLHDEHLAKVYERKRSEGMHHLVAMTHLMRLQLQRMVAILVDQQPFVARELEVESAA